MHSLKRLWSLLCLLFCLTMSGCGGRKEIRISGAEPVPSTAVQAAGSEENLPKTGDTPPGEAESGLTVYVCGEVVHPGVVELREGARIYEAVDASGGFTADADPERVNLAQPLTDGQMVVIASKEERTGSAEAGRAGIEASYPLENGTSGYPPSESGPGLPSSGSRVNLNTASREELMTLPGIGESKADAIIRYRKEKGCFLSPEDVMNISGIKDAVYGKIKELITV